MGKESQTAENTGETEQSQAAEQRQKHPEVRRRNYVLFSMEGGFFVGGIAFVSPEVVLPTIVHSLGGADEIISYLPTLMFIGFTLTPLFSAPIIENFDRMKPFTIAVGVFQRLPYLLAAIVLLLFGAQHPGVALAFVLAAPFLSGFIGGVSGPAWMTLQSRVIVPERRASANGLRNIIGALLGVAVGFLVDIILREIPGTNGYAVLHAGAFGLMVISLLLFSGIHEEPRPVMKRTRRTVLESLGALPEIIRHDHHYSLYLLSSLLFNGMFVLVPFLAIDAQAATGRGESFAGQLVVAQMMGNIAGNALFSVLGDRWGGKSVLIACRFAFLALVAAVLLVPKQNDVSWQLPLLGLTTLEISPTDVVFLCAFFLLGTVIAGRAVGSPTLMMELAPLDRTATYFSLAAAATLVGLLSAGTIAALLREHIGGLAPLAIGGFILVFASLIVMFFIKEPRKRREPAPE
jgi:MFS family permease